MPALRSSKRSKRDPETVPQKMRAWKVLIDVELSALIYARPLCEWLERQSRGALRQEVAFGAQEGSPKR